MLTDSPLNVPHGTKKKQKKNWEKSSDKIIIAEKVWFG